MTRNKKRLQKNDALIIVDVQNDFCPGGALPIRDGDQVVPVLNEWIRDAVSQGVQVYASRDWHPAGHLSFRENGGTWPPHCLQDSEGARFNPDLELPEPAIKVTKGVRFDQDQNSAFDQTGLAAQLKRNGTKRILVGGLAEDVCVLATVLDGIREGFGAVLISDGTRPVNEADGRRAREKMLDSGVVII